MQVVACVMFKAGNTKLIAEITYALIPGFLCLNPQSYHLTYKVKVKLLSSGNPLQP